MAPNWLFTASAGGGRTTSLGVRSTGASTGTPPVPPPPVSAATSRGAPSLFAGGPSLGPASFFTGVADRQALTRNGTQTQAARRLSIIGCSPLSLIRNSGLHAAGRPGGVSDDRVGPILRQEPSPRPLLFMSWAAPRRAPAR